MESKRRRNDIHKRWEWINDDKVWHKQDSPAVEYDNGNKFWYINGKRHREDGPAVEWYYGGIEYYLDDFIYSYLDWLHIIRNRKLEELLNGK